MHPKYRWEGKNIFSISWIVNVVLSSSCKKIVFRLLFTLMMIFSMTHARTHNRKRFDITQFCPLFRNAFLAKQFINWWVSYWIVFLGVFLYVCVCVCACGCLVAHTTQILLWIHLALESARTSMIPKQNWKRSKEIILLAWLRGK